MFEFSDVTLLFGGDKGGIKCVKCKFELITYLTVQNHKMVISTGSRRPHTELSIKQRLLISIKFMKK